MAEKGFGIKQLNIIGSTGTPRIESQTDISIRVGSGYTVGIGTSGVDITSQKADPLNQSTLNVGVVTANEYYGTFKGGSIDPGIAVENANNIKTTQQTTNGEYYLTFVDSDNVGGSYESVYTGAGITFTPYHNRLTVSGSISIGGTLTTDDITSVDSIGLITARSGAEVLNGGIKVGGGISITDGGLQVTAGITTILGALHDRDGAPGSNGNLLQSTGTQIDWVTPDDLTVENANKVGVGTTNVTGTYFPTFADSNNPYDNRAIESLYSDDRFVFKLNPTSGTTFIGIGTNLPLVELDVKGSLNVTGVTSTQYLDVVGLATIQQLGVTGVSTLTGDVHTGSKLLVTGITTLASAGGITTTGGDLWVGGDLFVQDDVVLDEGRFQSLVVDPGGATFKGEVFFDNPDNAARDVKWNYALDSLIFYDNTKAAFGDGVDLTIYHDATHSYIVNNEGKIRIQAKSGEDSIVAWPDREVEVYFDDDIKLITALDGIQVTGVTSTTSLNVLGIATFSGALHDKDGDAGIANELLSSTGTQVNWVSPDSVTIGKADQIKVNQVTGADTTEYKIPFVDSTAADQSYQNVNIDTSAGITYNPFHNHLTINNGGISIGGTLTYEDVTNVDAIGLVTARSGVRINGGGLNVTGVSTFSSHLLPVSNEVGNIGESASLRWNEVYAKEFFGTFKGTIDPGTPTVSIASSLTDLLGVYVDANVIFPKDADADKIMFWDDSETKATYLNIGTGLEIDGTTLNATSTAGKTYELPLTGTTGGDGVGEATWTLTDNVTPTPGTDPVTLKAGSNISIDASSVGSGEFTIAAVQGAGLALDATVTDVFDLTAGTLSADDPDADRIIFWDDSETKLTHLSVGSGLEIDGTELKADSSAGKTYSLPVTGSDGTGGAAGGSGSATLTLTDNVLPTPGTDPVTITAGSGIVIDSIAESGFRLSASGSGTLTDIEIKQYADQNDPRAVRSCDDPIGVVVAAGTATIGIGTTSNAYGAKYVQTADPTTTDGGGWTVCEGDIWYDTSTTGSGGVTVTNTADATYYNMVFITNSSSTSLLVNDDDRLQVRPSDGAVRVEGDITAFYSSDERLKDNIVPIPNALDKIVSLSGNTFEWNENSDHQGEEVGVIAQEVESLGLPGIAITRNDGTKAVRYEKLIPLLIEAIKELKVEIDELKATK